MPDLSLIIPAHNEAAVLRRLLQPLCEQAMRRGVDVQAVVVANGCTDNTVDVAREAWPEATVIDTQTPGKSNALNLGDATAGDVWPRCYVDGDVVIDLNALLQLRDALDENGVHAVAPEADWDLSHCSRAVRRFYAIDALMPSHREGIGGSGVYMVSKEGRARFDRWPKIIADDSFLRRHFKPDQRKTVLGVHSTVTPPASVGELVRIKTRSQLGNLELRSKYPQLTGNRGASNRPALQKLLLRPTRWPALATYAYVKGLARLRSRKQFAKLDQYVWERDDSSRNVPQASGG